MDLLHLIAEESQAVRMFQGIGEYVDDSAADGILARCRYEIDPLETLTDQDPAEFVIRNLITHIDGHEGSRYLILVRHGFFQSGRIGHNIQWTFSRIHDFADGRGALDTQGRLVIASFYGTTAVRKEEDAVAFHQIIKVRAAIFGRFPGRKDDKMGSFFNRLRYNEPARRQK